MRDGHESAVRGAYSTEKSETDSTEDLWNEDKYIPDAAYLPSPPDIRVNVSAIQPNPDQLEPKREIDETWDYDYDTKRIKNGATNGVSAQRYASQSTRERSDKHRINSPPCTSGLNRNLTMPGKEQFINGHRISPTFPRNPNVHKCFNGQRSPRQPQREGHLVHGRRQILGQLRPPLPARLLHNQQSAR